LDAEQAAVTDKTNGDLCIDANGGDTYEVAVPPAILFNVKLLTTIIHKEL